MTLSSMTGFARVEAGDAYLKWVWEARSVNGKGLDVRFKMPAALNGLEDSWRKAARDILGRGNVQISLQIDRDPAQSQQVRVNEGLLLQLVEQTKGISDTHNLAPARMDGLLAIRGVLEIESKGLDSDALTAPLFISLQELLRNLKAARDREGGVLHEVLQNSIHRVGELTASARQNPSTNPEVILEVLQNKLAVLAESFPEERLAQEAALLATKADVTEELDRLDGHVSSAMQLINSNEPCGRKLEFLSQEFHREANTLCAKSSDLALSKLGLEMKTVIDQIKEQAANVE